MNSFKLAGVGNLCMSCLRMVLLWHAGVHGQCIFILQNVNIKMLMLYEVMQKKQQDDLGNYRLKVWGQLPSLLLKSEDRFVWELFKTP